MRVILLTSAGNLSGGARQALYLAQGLSRRGHEVSFFVPNRAQLPSLDPAASFWAELGHPRQWRQRVEAMLPQDGSPCVVHAFHNAAVKRLAWWGLFLHRRGVVTVAHRGVVFRPNNPLPYWSPGIDCFAVNSQACAKVIRSLGVSAPRIRVVYNSVPDERITPARSAEAVRSELDLPSDIFLFGSVAGNNPVKGVEPLIRAFARSRTQTAHLLLVGVKRSQYGPLAAELGAADRIRFVERSNAVADYLQIMDVFVLPSLSESMPNTLLEALRMGLPAIASNVGGVPEILGNAGILTPPGDVDALAAALTRVHMDSEAREALSLAAISGGQAFAEQRRIDVLEDLYRELLAARGLDPER